MKQEIHTAINWLSRSALVALIEGNGAACNDNETTDELRDTVREFVECGDISEDQIL